MPGLGIDNIYLWVKELELDQNPNTFPYFPILRIPIQETLKVIVSLILNLSTNMKN